MISIYELGSICGLVSLVWLIERTLWEYWSKKYG